MSNSVVLSNWSIDAFDCLSSKLHKQLSAELISRVETFVSSVILFDSVILTENYKNNRIVKELNRRHPDLIKFVRGSDLYHSIDMKNHISIEIDLYHEAFEELGKENDIWQQQHDPKMYQAIINSPASDSRLRETLDAKFLTQLRLWHWCYTNEMAEITKSVNMLPLSLNAVGAKALKKQEKTDALLKKYFDFANYHNQKFIRLSEAINNPLISEIKSIPPLMTLLLTRCKTSDDMVHILSEMRDEFKEFRKLRHGFTNKIQTANNIGEKSEIVADWNRSWEQLCAGEFKEPDLLKRKMSSADVASTVVSTETGGVKSLITHVIEHYKYKKSYRQFQVFANLEEHINSISQNSSILESVFGVEKIVPLDLKQLSTTK